MQNIYYAEEGASFFTTQENSGESSKDNFLINKTPPGTA